MLESDLVMMRLKLYETNRTKSYAIMSYVVGGILIVISVIDVNRQKKKGGEGKGRC
jgi:hypothetical protein